ncbi:MAG: hypothetical protein M1450_02095 [Patescibacteria group bacterium]|nr:hypothetical protein [Patescibacteria group bacterium]
MRKKILPFLIILILVSFLSFLLGARFEGNKTKQVKQEPAPLKNLPQSPNLFNKEQAIVPSDKLIDPKKQIVLSTNISQVLRGTLVSYKKDSWIIRYNKDTLTVTQQVPDQKVSYFLTSLKTKKTTPVKAEDLKTGDYVNIVIQYMPKEEKMAVTSVNAYRD